MDGLYPEAFWHKSIPIKCFSSINTLTDPLMRKHA